MKISKIRTMPLPSLFPSPLLRRLYYRPHPLPPSSSPRVSRTRWRPVIAADVEAPKETPTVLTEAVAEEATPTKAKVAETKEAEPALAELAVEEVKGAEAEPAKEEVPKPASAETETKEAEPTATVAEEVKKEEATSPATKEMKEEEAAAALVAKPEAKKASEWVPGKVGPLPRAPPSSPASGPRTTPGSAILPLAVRAHGCRSRERRRRAPSHHVRRPPWRHCSGWGVGRRRGAEEHVSGGDFDLKILVNFVGYRMGSNKTP